MKLFVTVLCVFIGYCEAQEAKESPKCSIYDSECQKNFFQNVAIKYGPTGIKEIGIPVIDPLQLRPTTVNVFGLWNLTLTEGQCEGIPKCTVLSYKSDMKERTKSPDIICDTIVVRGRYKLEPAPVIKQINYLDFNAEGDITITFNKWHFKVKYPIKIVRHEDKKIYVEGVFDKATYESYMDKVSVSVTGIKLGGRDYSEQANQWINQNWKVLMASDIGKTINEVGAEYYYEMYDKFFKRTPASEYYNDNFESLVENK